MNGYSYGASRAGPGAWDEGDGSRDDRGAGEMIPHLNDIHYYVDVRIEELRPYPVTRLLEEARRSFNTAKLMMETRRGHARAYSEYLTAYQLVVDCIPRNPEYLDRIQTSRGGSHRQYKELMRDIQTYEIQFQNIKNIIVSDNKRNATQPKSISRQSSSTGSQHSRQTSSPVYGHQYSTSTSGRFRDDELMLPHTTSAINNGTDTSRRLSESPQRKPLVQPKPPSLHSRAVQSTNGFTHPDELAERFARLGGKSVRIDTKAYGADLSVKMPSPTDYKSSSRPIGPRDLPPPPSHPPPHPPKLSLNTDPPHMPREPSPTYSPARNLSLPESIKPPRSTARSMVGTGGRSNASAQAPYNNGDAESYFPAAGYERRPPSRRKSTGPQELQITADKLFDYFSLYSILLIDVRSRDKFDAGHIYHKYSDDIMCVEPTALQLGLSAEQLQDRLILSPDEEQKMFRRRGEYGLVVYYDQSTKTIEFLNKYNRNEREASLKLLFDTLYEFNTEQPLNKPPIFLMGGLDAWVELMGSQGLQMSNTQVKPARTIGRVAAASNSSRLAVVRRRRMREYAPIDPEEERKFLEEARRDRAVVEQPDDESEEEPTSPVYRTTEDFMRRFPAVEDQESMMYPPSRPAQLPTYAIPPPVTSGPPSRPAPAVPRPSYSGVHERQVTPHNRTSTLPAYVSPGQPRYYRLPRTGLMNFGVTCYMNSVIQCLSGTLDLSNIFLSGKFHNDIQRDNWKGTRGLMPEAYATLISNLWKNDVNSIRPTSFRKLCARVNSEWGIDQQQDAKEFLEFLLDLLHEDLNLTWSKPPLRTLTASEEESREKLPRPYAARIEWGRYAYREKSVIGDLFAGQHASRLACATCGMTSTTYEAFWSISVEIPQNRAADLRDCLRSYCSEERLCGDDIWRCPRCKVDREAKKKITITRAPNFLVIHLKRFSASRGESARKVRTPIEFPLHGLDLGPFMEPPMTPAQEEFVRLNARDGEAQLVGLKTDPAMNGPYIYNAYAVIRHLGSSLTSGHYVAMVKDKARGCWRQFNDDRVVDFEPGNLPSDDRLQNEKAYIVFYERERVAGGAF